MNRIRIVILLFFIADLCSAQDATMLAGRIVNTETSEPLAFSTVNVVGTPIGAVSNFEGYFELSFEPKGAMDSIRVSMLGYKPATLAINDLVDPSNLRIALEESVILLQEVEVNEKKLTALDIVNKVIERIPENYPNQPYLLEGFTRSHKHECGKYVTLYEAVFELFGRGYQKKTPEKIYVKEARQSQHMPYYHSRVLRSNRNLYNSMSHINDVLYRSYSLQTKHNQYEIDKYLIEDGELIYVIKTNHSKYVSHTMYVNANDYALLKVKMEMDTPADEDWNPLLNKGVSSDSLVFKVTRISKTIQFEKQGARYFSKYMDWLVEGKLYAQDTNEEFCDWGFRFENMFNDVQYPFDSKPSNEFLMNPRSTKDPASTAYNPSFWNEYMMLKEFPLTPQILTDLESNGSLESQFKQASK